MKLKKIDKSKKVTVLYWVLEIVVVGTMIDQFRIENYNNVFMCVLTLALFNIPRIVDKRLHITLPTAMEVIIVLFIFAAEILGEIRSFYTVFSGWDTMLHTVNGFLMAAIGFTMIDVLNNHPKFHISMSPFFVSFVSFCFSMTIGVMWEFFEFGMDYFFLTDMQKDVFVTSFSSVALNPSGLNEPVYFKEVAGFVINGVRDGVPGVYEYSGGFLDIGVSDTIKDLIVNCLGAVVFSVIGFFYIKNRGKGKIALTFIPQLRETYGDDDDSKVEKTT